MKGIDEKIDEIVVNTMIHKKKVTSKVIKEMNEKFQESKDMNGISKNGDKHKIGIYEVDLKEYHCTCEYVKYSGKICSHIYACILSELEKHKISPLNAKDALNCFVQVTNDFDIQIQDQLIPLFSL